MLVVTTMLRFILADHRRMVITAFLLQSIILCFCSLGLRGRSPALALSILSLGNAGGAIALIASTKSKVSQPPAEIPVIPTQYEVQQIDSPIKEDPELWDLLVQDYLPSDIMPVPLMQIIYLAIIQSGSGIAEDKYLKASTAAKYLKTNTQVVEDYFQQLQAFNYGSLHIQGADTHFLVSDLIL
jgi:hypothetical protein